MNQTAKKLRDIAQNAGVTPGSGKPYSVIATIKSAFGFDSILAAGVLLQFMAAIADELDELQARAAGANNLRQRLDSAEKKAERRKKQVEHTEDAIRERNARLKMRGETIARLTAENGELRKRVPSEREREILDMWPRFEEGEPVMVGDEFLCRCGKSHVCDGVRVQNTGEKVIFAANHPHAIFLKDGSEYDERAKRPAPKVLDADGVEIKLGDTVWHCIGIYDELVVEEIDDESGWVRTRSANGACLSVYNTHLTHTRPDSWERLVEDASKEPCSYFGYEDKLCGDGAGCPANKLGNCSKLKAADIVRRAKALAEAEAGR